MTTHPSSAAAALGATRLQQLRTLRDRLGDLSMRNRSLRLVRLYRKRAFDFAWLDAIRPGESHRLLQAVLSGQRRKAPILVVGSDDEHTQTTHRGLTYLDREVRLVEAERGVYDLSVGFPFLCGVLPENRYVQAPLFLLPRRLELERRAAGGTRWVLTPEDPTEVHVNRTLLLALQQYLGVTLDPEKLVDVAEAELFGKLSASAALLGLTTAVAAHLEGLTVTPTLAAWGKAAADSLAPVVPPLPEYASTELPTPKPRTFELRPHAVLSRFPLADTALLADYDALIRLIEQAPDRKLGYTGALLGERDAIRDAQRPRDAAPPPRWHVEPTDESQDEVLAQVLAGRSLAVSGPPGTGKSQLIANLVATALAEGKRVLVVSQKRPALDVVAQRLGPELEHFVALVHDPVRDQQGVRNRLLATLGRYRFAVAQPATGPRDRILREIRSLEGRFDELHRALVDDSAGLTSFDAYGHRVRHSGTPAKIQVHALPPLDPDGLEEALPALEQLVRDRAFARTPGTWREHRPDFGGRAIDTLERFVSTTLPRASAVLADARHWEDGRGSLPTLTATAASSAIHQALDAWCRQVEPQHASDPRFWRTLSAPHDALQSAIDRVEQLVRLRQDAGEEVLRRMGSEEIDRAERVLDRYTALTSDPFRVLYPSWYETRNEVRSLLLVQGLPLEDLEGGIREWRRRAAYTRGCWSANEVLASFGLDVETDEPEQVLSLLRHVRQVTDAWRALSTEARRAFDSAERPPSSADALNALAEWVAHALVAAPIAARLAKIERSLRDWVGPAAAEWIAEARRADDPEALQRRFRQEVEAAFEALAEADRRIAETERRYPELVPIVEQLAVPGAPPLDTELRTAYAERWVRDAETRHPALRRSRQEQDDADRARLAALWHELPELNRTILAARLGAAVTEIPAAKRTQLERRAEQKRNRWTLRKLVEAFWSEGLSEVLPVWLCSPEAVAAIFPMAPSWFDLVVFDEASQCTVEQGLTAVYRGHTCVVAGDEQQLPPSRLFSTTLEEDDEDIDSPSEEESLLSRAKALGAEAALSWHYRSRFPELIAFSNLRFYNRGLRVAPVPVSRLAPPALQWVAVHGSWTKRANEAEAALAVELLDRFLRDHPDQSVGIITLNRQQADWIQDLIDTRARESKAFRDRYEQAMKGDLDTRPFVRNLENVQGDERDVILLSVAYSADATGRVPLRFGSLNLAGGERRLNVAVSRARRKMVVLCSFDPETQLLPTEATSRGAQELAAFLRYARKAGDSAGAEVAGYAWHDLVYAVAEALREAGWTVDLGVGTSEARVDIGVRSRTAPDRHALGVLFDGPGASWARTAIGREVGRVAFLERYHWRIRVLSSRGLAKDFQGGIRQLLQELQEAEAALDAVASPPSVAVPIVPPTISSPTPPQPVRPRRSSGPPPPTPMPADPRPSTPPPPTSMHRSPPPPAEAATDPAPRLPFRAQETSRGPLFREVSPPTASPPTPEISPPAPTPQPAVRPTPAPTAAPRAESPRSEGALPAATSGAEVPTAGPGYTVTYRNRATQREYTITLAGPTVPRGQKVVELDAPVAQMLLGADVGDILEHPSLPIEIEVLALRPPPVMPEIP